MNKFNIGDKVRIVRFIDSLRIPHPIEEGPKEQAKAILNKTTFTIVKVSTSIPLPTLYGIGQSFNVWEKEIEPAVPNWKEILKRCKDGSGS